LVPRDGRTSAKCCWLCNTSNVTEETGSLFTPCLCPRPVHRGCFRQWRQGWMSPTNYFECPLCDTAYNIQRVRPEDDASLVEHEADRRYNKKVMCTWLALIVVLAATVASIAGIAYLCDASQKRVPVVMKYMMTSVASGLPTGNNTTAIWEAEFKDPQHHVWPYYLLLSALVVSVGILVAVPLSSCRSQTSNGPSRTCGDQCCHGPCNVCSSGCWWMWWFNKTPPHYNHGAFHDPPNKPSLGICRAACCCGCCCCAGGAGCCLVDGGSGAISGYCSRVTRDWRKRWVALKKYAAKKCKWLDMDCSGVTGDCGAVVGVYGFAAVVLLLIVAFMVLVGGIFGLILLAASRVVELHRRLTDMLLSQELERANEAIALGGGETLHYV
jgi:hypothetical protein